MGRILDVEYPGFPANYPNSTHEDPFAVVFSTGSPKTCQGHEGNFAYSVLDPSSTEVIEGGTTTGTQNTYQGQHIDYLSTLGQQANIYGGELENAYNLGNSVSTNYGTDAVSEGLRNVVKLISGGLKTKIYIIKTNGFDNHSNQVSSSNSSTGRHADLLKSISQAIGAFQEDLNALNLSDRVLGMTYSEFGRQITENGSRGTDHGNGSCMFLFGSCISTPVVGANPVIPDTLISGNASMSVEIDYRDIYASILKNWFEVAEVDIEANFEDYGGITYYDLFADCAAVGLDEKEKEKLNVEVYPNPTTGDIFIEMELNQGNALFTMVNLSGELIGEYERNIPFSGVHKLSLPTSKLASGVYFLRVRSENLDKRAKFVVGK